MSALIEDIRIALNTDKEARDAFARRHEVVVRELHHDLAVEKQRANDAECLATLRTEEVIDLTARLAQATTERDALAEALDHALVEVQDWSDHLAEDGGYDKVKVHKRYADPKAILAAHDAAKDAETAGLKATLVTLHEAIEETIARCRGAAQSVLGDPNSLLPVGIVCALVYQLQTKTQEIAALSAGLRLAHDQMREQCIPDIMIDTSVGLDACKRALEEHDRALVKPLVEALLLHASHGATCASRKRGDPPCDCGLDAALAPYKAATCPRCNGTRRIPGEHVTVYETDTAEEVADAHRMAERACPDCVRKEEVGE